MCLLSQHLDLPLGESGVVRYRRGDDTTGEHRLRVGPLPLRRIDLFGLFVKSGERMSHLYRGATEGNFPPEVAFSGTSETDPYTSSLGREGLMR